MAYSIQPHYPDPDDFGQRDDYDDRQEPFGSCEWCGGNLYPGDSADLCDSCDWQSRQVNRDEGEDRGGIQPIT